jgi:hypothetical protein
MSIEDTSHTETLANYPMNGFGLKEIQKKDDQVKV